MQPPKKDPKRVSSVKKTTNTVLDTLSRVLTPAERGGVHDWTLMVLTTLLLVWASAQAYRLALYAHYYLQQHSGGF